MHINRDIEKELESLMHRKEIFAIVGPRQVGKSTILKKIYKNLKNSVYIDFEDRKVLEIFDNDIETFITLYVKDKDYLFIDEFQYSKKGGQKLKYIFDNFKIKIFISGSSSTELSIPGIKYLVGRVFIFNLYPLSFKEFISFKDKKLLNLIKENISKQAIDLILPHLNEFLIYGGYPEVVLAKDKKEKEIILKNIYNTYLLKEIKQILNIEDDYKIIKLIKALSLQISGLLNYNELSNITRMNYNELLKKINVLEKTFICKRSYPHYTNKRTELVKTPKIFFYDNGFRNICLNNFQNIDNRTDKGNLIENFVATELIKLDIDLKFWRTKSKAEVDFIIEKNSEIIPVEIKSNLLDNKIPRSLREFILKYNPKKNFILSLNLNTKKENVNFKPVFYINKIIE